MLRWMFWEQYNHEPNIATLRFWMRWIGPDKLNALQKMQVPVKRASGEAALKLMDEHLAGRRWFVGDGASLADICLFAYTHVAADADFDLGRYPNVTAWIERVEALPNYVPMTA
jgi:glutathione S-transferase